MRRQKHPAAKWEMARQMRAAGQGWYTIERATGITYHVLRGELEPGYREMRSAQDTNRRNRMNPPLRMKIHKFVPFDRDKATPDEARRAIASIPRDTRSFTGKAFGDPLPGRSALDRMRSSRSKFSTGASGENWGYSLAGQKAPMSMGDRHSNSEAVT